MSTTIVRSEVRQAESQLRRLLRAVFNYGLGAYIPQLINFFLLPVYARYLSPSDMGILELCVSGQILIAPLMRLGLPGSISRYYFELNEGPLFRDFVTTVGCAVATSSVCVAATVFLLGDWLFSLANIEHSPHPYLEIALLGAVVQGSNDLQRRLLQAREQSGLSARISVITALASIALSCIAVIYLKLGALGVLYSSLVVGIASTIFLLAYNRNDFSGKFNFSYLKQSMQYGLPLVPHHVAASAHQYLSRFLLFFISGASIVGILSVASRVTSPLTVIIGAFASAYSPVYFSWRASLSPADALANSQRIGRLILSLGAIGTLAISLFGRVFVIYGLPSTFRESADLVGIIAVAQYVHLIYHLITVEIFQAKATLWISAIFVFSAALNLGLLTWLFTEFGAVGVGLAQLAGGFLSLLLVCVFARRSFSLPVTPLALFIASVVCATACAYPLTVSAAGLVGDIASSSLTILIATISVVLLSGAGGDLVNSTGSARTTNPTADLPAT